MFVHTNMVILHYLCTFISTHVFSMTTMSFSLSVALCNTVPLLWALWNCFVWFCVKLPLVYPSKYVLILHGLCVVFSLLLNMICYLYCLDSLYLLNCVLCLIPWAQYGVQMLLCAIVNCEWFCHQHFCCRCLLEFCFYFACPAVFSPSQHQI